MTRRLIRPILAFSILISAQAFAGGPCVIIPLNPAPITIGGDLVASRIYQVSNFTGETLLIRVETPGWVQMTAGGQRARIEPGETADLLLGFSARRSVVDQDNSTGRISLASAARSAPLASCRLTFEWQGTVAPRLSVDREFLAARPGVTETTVIRIANAGDRLLHGRIEAIAPAGWQVSIKPDRLTIKTGESGEALLRLTPAENLVATPEAPVTIQWRDRTGLIAAEIYLPLVTYMAGTPPSNRFDDYLRTGLDWNRRSLLASAFLESELNWRNRQGAGLSARVRQEWRHDEDSPAGNWVSDRYQFQLDSDGWDATLGQLQPANGPFRIESPLAGFGLRRRGGRWLGRFAVGVEDQWGGGRYSEEEDTFRLGVGGGWFGQRCGIEADSVFIESERPSFQGTAYGGNAWINELKTDWTPADWCRFDAAIGISARQFQSGRRSMVTAATSASSTVNLASQAVWRSQYLHSPLEYQLGEPGRTNWQTALDYRPGTHWSLSIEYGRPEYLFYRNGGTRPDSPGLDRRGRRRDWVSTQISYAKNRLHAHLQAGQLTHPRPGPPLPYRRQTIQADMAISTPFGAIQCQARGLRDVDRRERWRHRRGVWSVAAKLPFQRGWGQASFIHQYGQDRIASNGGLRDQNAYLSRMTSSFPLSEKHRIQLTPEIELAYHQLPEYDYRLLDLAVHLDWAPNASYHLNLDLRRRIDWDNANNDTSAQLIFTRRFGLEPPAFLDRLGHQPANSPPIAAFFLDHDGNMRHDAGEPPVPFAAIRLGAQTYRADENGLIYGCPNHPADIAALTVDQSSLPRGHVATIVRASPTGHDNASVSIPVAKPATLTVVVYIDHNRNHQPDPGETLSDNARIRLRNAKGRSSFGRPSNGRLDFTRLYPGTYGLDAAPRSDPDLNRHQWIDLTPGTHHTVFVEQPSETRPVNVTFGEPLTGENLPRQRITTHPTLQYPPGRIILGWTPVEAAIGYQLKLDTRHENGLLSKTIDVSGATATIDGAPDDQSKSVWSVRPILNIGDHVQTGAWSDPMPLEPDGTPAAFLLPETIDAARSSAGDPRSNP